LAILAFGTRFGAALTGCFFAAALRGEALGRRAAFAFAAGRALTLVFAFVLAFALATRPRFAAFRTAGDLVLRPVRRAGRAVTLRAAFLALAPLAFAFAFFRLEEDFAIAVTSHVPIQIDGFPWPFGSLPFMSLPAPEVKRLSRGCRFGRRPSVPALKMSRQSRQKSPASRCFDLFNCRLYVAHVLQAVAEREASIGLGPNRGYLEGRPVTGVSQGLASAGKT
jgi:hypothetical protein